MLFFWQSTKWPFNLNKLYRQMFAKRHRACAKSKFLEPPCMGHPENHQQAYFGNIAVYGTEANGYTCVAFL